MRGICATLAVLSAVAWVRPAGAQGSDLQSLLSETVITTASKSAEMSSTAPATSIILTAEDIRTYGIHSIDEAIDFLSLGAVTSSTLRAADVGARGVMLSRDQGNHILLLVNGHAVNEPLFGAARFERGAGIPMESIDHIEVILGPGSVLYGSNAMLGVINVVTKRASASPGTRLVLESEVQKSWRVGASAAYEPVVLGTKGELTVALEYYRQDGPTLDLPPLAVGNDWSTGKPRRFTRAGEPTGIWGGPAAHSYYAVVPAGMATFRWKQLEVNVHASTYKRAAPYNSTFLAGESDFDDGDNYERDRSAFVDIQQQGRVSQVVELSARVYGDTFDYQRFLNTSGNFQCLYAGVFTCRQRTIGVSRRAGVEVKSSWDWLKNGSLLTVVGADGRTRFVSASADVFDRDTERPVTSTLGFLKETDQVLGVYVQQMWSPNNWLTSNVGGRLDFDERFGRAFSPRAAVTVHPWDGSTLKGIYSEAFRAPSWQESAWSGQQQLLAHDLRPERVRSVEALFEQTLRGHRLMFGVFRSWWHDLVEEHALTRAELIEAQLKGELPVINTNAGTQFRNVSSIDNYGFNAGYSGAFASNRLRYGANITGAIARRREPGTADAPLQVGPQLFGNLRVSYALASPLPTFAIATHYAAQRPTDRADSARYDQPPFAPAQLEVRATVTGPVSFARGLSYRVSANYAVTSRGAYIIGPVPIDAAGAPAGTIPPEYLPVDRFRATLGLQYDFERAP